MGGCAGECYRYSKFCDKCGHRTCHYRDCHAGNIPQSDINSDYCKYCFIIINELDSILNTLDIISGKIIDQDFIDKFKRDIYLCVHKH